MVLPQVNHTPSSTVSSLKVHVHRCTQRCIRQFAILMMCIFVCFKRVSFQGCENVDKELMKSPRRTEKTFPNHSPSSEVVSKEQHLFLKWYSHLLLFLQNVYFILDNSSFCRNFLSSFQSDHMELTSSGHYPR